MSAGEIRLVGLSKTFGSSTAVDSIDLDIPGGEFFSLLGPSGCGKTTTLRMIAGFEQPTTGEVRLDGDDMSGVPPARRNVHTVFQSYALFPHLTVFDNVAFGLRRKKVPKTDLRRRVDEAMELVELVGFADRKPAQLSGGQQQRVALARALVLRPAVLLLDEPLGALDAKLRRQLQVELKQLQEQVRITFVYVTHDQEEALTMSDRIAVMNRGHVEQVGRPRDVYEAPSTAFVADFLGVSNLMDAVVLTPATATAGATVRLGDAMDVEARAGDVLTVGSAKVVIRPERVGIEEPGTGGAANRVPGMVQRTVYLGSGTQVSVLLATGHTITALVQNVDESDLPWTIGHPVACHLPPSALRVLSSAGAPAREPELDPAAAEQP